MINRKLSTIDLAVIGERFDLYKIAKIYGVDLKLIKRNKKSKKK